MASASEADHCGTSTTIPAAAAAAASTVTSLTTSADLPASRLVVRGLPNLGNTCYFNSTLQCLSSLSTVISFAKRAPRHNEGDVTLAFKRVCASVNVAGGGSTSGGGTASSPGDLLSAVSRKAKRFQGRAQQDAQELLTVLLDAVDDEERDRTKKAMAAAKA